MSLMSSEQAEKLNAAVLFHPYRAAAAFGDPDELPCIEIGGVQVYAYADPERGLRIALHFDSAEVPLMPAGSDCVPIEVDLTGIRPVYAADHDGSESYPALAEDAEEVRCAAARVGQHLARMAGHPACDAVADLHGLSHVLVDRVIGR